MTPPEKIVFFGHHKCGTRFFRLSLLGPILEANGYEILGYRIKSPPFHFRGVDELDLHNLEFERFGLPGRKLLNAPNASPNVVSRAYEAAPGLRGIHVIRDPRQMLVSNYFHNRDGHKIESQAGWVWDALKEDRPVLLALPLEDGLIHELEHISHDILANQLSVWKPRDDVIEFRIEDFEAADSYDAPAMRDLASFLGVPILPPLRFERRFANKASRPWRDVFTPKITRHFKDRWGALLIDLGYERDLDW